MNDVEDLMEIFDIDRDGRVSYMEFSKNLSDCDGGKTIDDPNHWAYPLFEDIRRKVSRRNRPFIELFGM
jgi:hypothetical protein